MKNASDFPGLYDDIFDFAGAGYVMIDVSNPLWPGDLSYLEARGYTSPDSSKFWMQGLSTSWHVTARGPLDNKVRQEHCKRIMDEIELPIQLRVGDIETFPSPYPNEQYDCVVVNIDDDALFDINAQLALLPGVQTYVPYLPHVTVGYFKPGHTEEIEAEVNEWLNNYVDVIGIDYGRMKP